MRALQLEPAASAWCYAGHVDRPERFASLAVQALVDEAGLSPKPGLVDSRGSGVHTDLDLGLMVCSARALEPAFAAMAHAGARVGAAWGAAPDVPPLALRETLGQLGRDAEAAMLHVTGGVNTHRGAIWGLGLLVAAAAMECEGATADQVANTAGRIARLSDRHALPATGHKGELACRTYGVRGARGQAQDGFPQVVDGGLPVLRASRARGDSETAARLNALLAIMSVLDDTCVLSRAGPGVLTALQAGAAAVLAAGGVASLAGRAALRRLDALASARNASPGGAADLLAATLFLDACVAPVASSGDLFPEKVHGEV